eukprot:Gb_08454 [translate_table: standard]
MRGGHLDVVLQISAHNCLLNVLHGRKKIGEKLTVGKNFVTDSNVLDVVGRIEWANVVINPPICRSLVGRNGLQFTVLNSENNFDTRFFECFQRCMVC